MNLPLQTAIEIAKNKRVQRIAIGFVVGGVVGFAVAKVVEPYLFAEGEYEMIPPYDTPELAMLQDKEPVEEMTQIKVEVPEGSDPKVVQARVIEMIKTEAHVAPKLKYAKPVRPTNTHAAAVSPTVQPLTAGEKLQALNEPAPKPLPVKTEKPVVSTFSSTRGVTTANTGGGNPHKKVRLNPDGE